MLITLPDRHRLFSLAFTIFLGTSLLLPVILAKDVVKSAENLESTVSGSIEVIESLIPAIEVAEQNLEAARAELAAADAAENKDSIAKRVESQREKIAQLRANFHAIAAGVEDSAYLGEEEVAKSFEDEIRDLINPVLQEIRDATAQSRRVGQMRSNLVLWSQRLDLAQSALAKISSLQGAISPTSKAAEELEKTREIWQGRFTESKSQVETLRLQIEQYTGNEPTTLESISRGAAKFWRVRGLNLVLGLGSGLLVFFGIRRIWRIVRRRIGPRDGKKHMLFSRLADVIAAAASVLLAVAVTVSVFYLRGDWFMLTLILIALLGVLWASKTALPPYIDQVKLMLDIGPVRIEERIIINGLPYRVDSLNFQCEFSNPALRNGKLRLPAKDVIAMRSRPASAEEAWFPTEEGDWIKLSNGCYGCVDTQSPEQVVIRGYGGLLTTYSAAAFLAQNPQNLSRGFRIRTTFGIGYEHQSIATDEVLSTLHQGVKGALGAKIDLAEDLINLGVEFENAADCSLEIIVFADLRGSVANQFDPLTRLLQATCTKICTENDWQIPYPQLVVHQAE